MKKAAAFALFPGYYYYYFVLGYISVKLGYSKITPKILLYNFENELFFINYKLLLK